MKVSAKNIAFSAAVSMLFGACGKSEKELTPAEISARADSIVQSQMEKMNRQAREDLDKRLPIEVKPKVDSLRNISHTIDQVPVFPEGTDDDDAGNSPATLPSKDTVKK